ncbi:MAG: GMC family oxidoreductase [Myxococcota bacterium]
MHDVVVVGAGPAGSVVADALRRGGLDILHLEAGPRLGKGQDPLEIDEDTWRYEVLGLPFQWMRVRAVGGRALLWGGWAERFHPAVFRDGPWPYSMRTILPYYRRAEALMDVRPTPAAPRYERVAEELGLTITPKNMATHRGQPWTPLALRTIRRTTTRMIVLSVDGDGKRGVSVRAWDVAREREVRLSARAAVLAASPVETTRILLMSELPGGHRAIGRNLTDHMIGSFLLLEPRPPPRHGAGAVVPSALVQRFVNVGKDTKRSYHGGFCIELMGPASLSLLRPQQQEMLGMSSAESQGWNMTMIHAMGEVFPHRQRFVDLHPVNRDALGRPVPRLHLAWSRDDRRMAADMRQACMAIADEITLPGSRLVPFHDPLQKSAVGHEAGTCAMGTDPSAATDAWGRLRAAPRVWIADASALPTAGDRHPTLTIAAHALRVARDVQKRLQA